MTEATHHDHGHSHGPPADDLQGYYTEQLFTIGACGALGGVAIVLYTSGKLVFILHPSFHIWVLLGGLTLLALVFARGLCLWIAVGEPTAEPVHDHDHKHEHGPACDHDHDHGHDHHHTATAVTSLPLTAPAPAQTHTDHGHSHGHSHGGDDGHGHGWAPWRYVILLVPVALFFFDLPNKAMIQAKDVSPGFTVPDAGTGTSRGEDFSVSFKMLEQAALTPEGREVYTDKTVRLVGVFAGNDENRFTLTRPTINCCAADSVMLHAVILVDYRQVKDDPSSLRLDSSQLSGGKWVQVTGTVKFLKAPDTGNFTTVLIVTPTKSEPTPKLVELLAKPPANQYVY